MLRCIVEMKKETRASCSKQLKELSKCLCAACVCICTTYVQACVCVLAEHYAEHVFMCVRMNRCQPMFAFCLSSQTPHSPSKQEDCSYFSFYLDSSHLQKSCLLHLYPGASSAARMALVKAAQRERGCRWKREYALGILAVPYVLVETERAPPSPKMSLFVPKRLVCHPELQRFCASGPTRSALLTQIHPGPYHLEDIMAKRLAGHFDGSERLSCCQLC